MGGLVSSLLHKDEPRQQRPTHISFSSLSPAFRSLPSSPAQRDNPFERPLLSPALTFYTAPSTPLNSPQYDAPPGADSPPEIVLHVPPPPTPPQELPPIAEQPAPAEPPAVATPAASLAADDAFPNIDQVYIDPSLDDEGLSSLEKIYLFSRSQAAFHRVYIMNALPAFLAGTTPAEAVGYVLPLLMALATDPDEQVKETLAAQLVPVLWWFYTHCEIVEDEDAVPLDWNPEGDVGYLSVQSFTPILGILLLSPNPTVGGPTRFAVVDILARLRKLDDWEDTPCAEVAEGDEDIYVDTLTRAERSLLREELLQQVVIGMGRLGEDEMADSGSYDDDGHWLGEDDESLTPQENQLAQEQLSTTATASPVARAEDVVNPYFPAIPEPGSEVPTAGSTTPVNGASAESSTSTGAPMHVSFAQLPAAPAPVAAYHAEDAPQVARSPEPDWVAQTVHATGIQPEPPVARQEAPEEQDAEMEEMEGDEDAGFAEEQAAAGRLSSMSLIAAVVASGPVDAHTQTAFVGEVERIGRDELHWVRREASFALGALAKIVPHEVVLCSLLPLFDSLRQDGEWNVRHSALFALPAILSRLDAKQRRSLALDAVVPLAADESAPVRLGVLEALGEVLHTFHGDDGGPPEELLRLFVGRAEDRRIREEKPHIPTLIEKFAKHPVWGGVPESEKSPRPQEEEPPIESFYKDPSRPLICAFNYPAVALTLGRRRWDELVELYRSLAGDSTPKVRRTLAASLGEMAKIIGPDFAERDLMPVWRSSIKCDDDGETRLKAIESIEAFVNALDTGRGREEVPQDLLDAWREGKLHGWRERRGAVGVILGLARAVGDAQPNVILGLLKLALADSVAGVREEAISLLPQIWGLFGQHTGVIRDLEMVVSALGHSPSFRSRMTYIASQRALVLPDSTEKPARKIDAAFWRELKTLVDDPIIGVRIALARFVGLLRQHFVRDPHPIIPGALNELATKLSNDSAKEVQSFVASYHDQAIHAQQHDRMIVAERRQPARRHSNFATFSRPPPPPDA